MAKNEVAKAGTFNLLSVYTGMSEEQKAEYQDELDDLGGSGIDYRQIKMPTGKVKTFIVESEDPEDPDMEKELRGVILFTHLMNARWEGDYSGENRLPVCTSWDAKQGVVMSTGECVMCDHCKYNQFRERADGTMSKECKNMRRIYLMLDGKPQLYLLTVPPTSLKDTQKQLRRIMSGGKPYTQIVLSFTLTGAVSKGGQDYAKLSISYVGDLSQEQVALTKTMRAEIRDQFKDIAITSEDYDISASAAGRDSAAGNYDAGTSAAERDSAENAPDGASLDGFMNIPDGIEEDLPFN